MYLSRRDERYVENKDFEKQFPKSEVFVNGIETFNEEKCESNNCASNILSRAQNNKKSNNNDNNKNTSSKNMKSRRLSLSSYRPPSPTRKGAAFFKEKNKNYDSPVTEVKPFGYSPSPEVTFGTKYKEYSPVMKKGFDLSSESNHHSFWGKENDKCSLRVEDPTDELELIEESTECLPVRRILGKGWIINEADEVNCRQSGSRSGSRSSSIERSSSSVSSSSAEDSTPSTSCSGTEEDDECHRREESKIDEEERRQLEEEMERLASKKLKKEKKNKKRREKKEKRKKRPHAPSIPRPPSPEGKCNDSKTAEQQIIRPMIHLNDAECQEQKNQTITEMERKYQGEEKSMKRDVGFSYSSSNRKILVTLDNLHILRPFRTNQMIHCLLKRSTKGVMGKLNPTYTLELQNEHWQSIGTIMKVQKKRKSRTPYYAFFDMTKGSIGKQFSKKSGNYLGKLRSNYGGSECTLYGPEAIPSGHVAVRFCRNKQDIISKAQGNSDPRAMRVLLPLVESGDDDGTPPVIGTNGDTMLEMLQDQADFEETEQLGLNANRRRRNPDEKKYNDGNDQYLLLGNKLPVFSRGSYRLNFGGRVTLPSVKNFQLVKMSRVIEENMNVDIPNLDDVMLQFGRVSEDDFHLDFRAPMTAFQAMGIVLAQFNF
jgi:hypothetical protein